LRYDHRLAASEERARRVGTAHFHQVSSEGNPSDERGETAEIPRLVGRHIPSH
jgi:hypothetical protein